MSKRDKPKKWEESIKRTDIKGKIEKHKKYCAICKGTIISVNGVIPVCNELGKLRGWITDE